MGVAGEGGIQEEQEEVTSAYGSENKGEPIVKEVVHGKERDIPRSKPKEGKSPPYPDEDEGSMTPTKQEHQMF